MRWWTFAVGVCLSIGSKVNVLGQDLLAGSFNTSAQEPSSPGAWDASIGDDATGNLIFQSLASLLQLAPNSRYPNGHSIVRATIPTGTLLYHGRPSNLPPTRDWLAFDPEHAMMFAPGVNGTLFTYVTTRRLNVIYFDGASANKFNGVVDSQDILLWGQVNHVPRDGAMGELDRMDAGCAWGQQYDLDGLLRMQLDFELMYCDFSQGIQLISTASMVAGDGILNAPSPDRREHGFSDVQAPMQMPAHNASDLASSTMPFPRDRPKPRLHPVAPPPGWKGSLPSSFLQGRHAGTWHNWSPGEVRIKVYTSSMITFYDPALESLVQARRQLTRDAYRLEGISREDTARIRADIEEAMARDPAAGSGVDWQALAHTVQDRFSDRLPFIRDLLHLESANATAHAVQVRTELIASLLPYMQREDVGTPEWFAHIAHGCATRFTAHLPSSSFTKQERTLRNAIDEVLHESCRVYTEAWREAFDVEEQSADVAEGFLGKWQCAFDALVEWLDWPAWMTCNPSCAVDEYCYVPQAAAWKPDVGREPRCLKIQDTNV